MLWAEFNLIFFINLRRLTLSCLLGEYIFMIHISNFTSMYSPNQMKPKFIRKLDVHDCGSYPTVSIWQYFYSPALKMVNCTVYNLYINNNERKILEWELGKLVSFSDML